MADREVIQVVKDCIRKGDFTLHSGQKSNWICDLNIAHTSLDWLGTKMDCHPTTLVGIEFLGAMIAKQKAGNFAGYIRKNGSLYAPQTFKEITLIDDVVTIETSFKWAEEILSKHDFTIASRWVVLDRRPPGENTLEINSLVTAADLWELP